MAARLRKTHQEDVKKKIQASQLINFLQNHALTEGSEASQSRVDAAKFLLNKIISNAPQQTELTGEDGGPIAFIGKIERVIVNAAN